MNKDKWLLLSITFLIIALIEGYNFGKTITRHKTPAGESTAVAVQKGPGRTTQAVKADDRSAKKEKSGLSVKDSGLLNQKKEEPVKSPKKDETTSEQVKTVLPEAQGKEPPSPKRAKAVPVVFTYTDAGATEVTFHGSWSGKANPMTKKGSVWTFKTRLNPGEFAYHFRVDGVKKVNEGPTNAAGDNIIKVVPAE